MPAGATRDNASGTSAPTGAKMIAASSGRAAARWTIPPTRRRGPRKLLRRGVAWRRERVDLARLVHRHLRDDVRRGAKSVNPMRPASPAIRYAR